MIRLRNGAMLALVLVSTLMTAATAAPLPKPKPAEIAEVTTLQYILPPGAETFWNRPAVNLVAFEPTPAPVPAPVPAPPASSGFSFGSLIGDVLLALVTVFAVPIGTFASTWVRDQARRVGIEVTQARQDQLQTLIVNGMHSVAADLAKDIDGKLVYDTKSDLVDGVLQYVQTHGIDLIKSLGGNKGDPGKLFDAVKARVEVALADAKVPISMAPAPLAPVVDQADLKSALDAIRGQIADMQARLAPQQHAA